jgi:hypothetical protein
MRLQRARIVRLLQTLRSMGLAGRVLATTLIASCIVRDGAECDTNQMRVTSGASEYCECKTGFVNDTDKGYGCRSAMLDAGGNSLDASMLGDAAPAADAGGPATSGCSKSSPCPANQRCEDGTCSDVTGLGKSCTAAADCAGQEASNCNTFLPAPACVVSNCAANTALCPTGYVCCAIAGMSNCAQGAACPPPLMMVP